MSGTLFSNVNNIQSMIPEGHKNVTTQWCSTWRHFTAATYLYVLIKQQCDISPKLRHSNISCTHKRWNMCIYIVWSYADNFIKAYIIICIRVPCNPAEPPLYPRPSFTYDLTFTENSFILKYRLVPTHCIYKVLQYTLNKSRLSYTRILAVFCP